MEEGGIRKTFMKEQGGEEILMKEQRGKDKILGGFTQSDLYSEERRLLSIFFGTWARGLGNPSVS